MIPVTKSYIPSIELFNSIVARAFESGWLTNRGELVLELEELLRSRFQLDHLLITNNGTVPLQISLKLLAQGGEVITTPFSYVATTSSIVWEGCTPVFVDIEPETLTIDPLKIEEAITTKTKAILATHVFGNPCDVEAIQRIADKHKLKVIYDAAHCFDVEYLGKSIFSYGDISTCSFHATKLFHTGEGGAIFTNDKNLFHKIYYSHNFGHDGPLNFHGLGINAKISELHAAMGLAVLPALNKIKLERKKIVDLYLTKLDTTQLQFLKLRDGTKWNYSYFPVLFKNEDSLLRVEKALLENEILPRRYFYPSLNSLPFVKYQKMPVSESASSRILCLPLYYSLKKEDVQFIINTINLNIC